MPFVNTEEQALLNYYNGKTSHGLSVPTTVWYGLHIGAQPPDLDAGTFTEPSDANYARVSKTLGSLFNAASAGDPTDADNAAAITWPESAAAYSDDIYYVLEFISETATTFRRCFKLSSPATIGSSDIPEIDGSKLISELGDSGDTFNE